MVCEITSLQYTAVFSHIICSPPWRATLTWLEGHKGLVDPRWAMNRNSIIERENINLLSLPGKAT